MKKFLITYNVRFTENGTDQTAETCTTLEVAEERMDELQTSGGGISTWLENPARPDRVLQGEAVYLVQCQIHRRHYLEVFE